MRYVIIRDDDTNALTPVECLEKLYRPFLNRSLPVNLAVIPNVATNTTLPDGRLEGFLLARNGTKEQRFEEEVLSSNGLQTTPHPPFGHPLLHSEWRRGMGRGGGLVLEETLPITSSPELVSYLRNNPGYQIVQHGYRHDYFEFDRVSAEEVEQRLKQGTRLLLDAGFEEPKTFVAPYDKLSRDSLRAVAKRFPVLSTGWFELRRLPVSWWPNYFSKKISKASHWRVGQTILLSHPGCLLSCHRDYDGMLQSVIDAVNSRQLTVLVTHWWEYFRDGKLDERFIHFLHQTADYLASQSDIRVIAFSDLVRSRLRLN